MNPEAFLDRYGDIKRLEKELVHLKKVNSAAVLELESMMFRAIVYMDRNDKIAERFLRARQDVVEDQASSLLDVAEAALEYLVKVEKVNLKEYKV